ncbi:MAG: hypothetical protein ACJAWV_001403, partial [Flammeovirgaceae bacterium]
EPPFPFSACLTHPHLDFYEKALNRSDNPGNPNNLRNRGQKRGTNKTTETFY